MGLKGSHPTPPPQLCPFLKNSEEYRDSKEHGLKSIILEKQKSESSTEAITMLFP